MTFFKKKIQIDFTLVSKALKLSLEMPVWNEEICLN